jgi:putative membrane protein
MAETLVAVLPHLNATLNALATVLLITGYLFIKQKKVTAHKWSMLSCFGVSVVFLISYLTYHTTLTVAFGEHGRPFPEYPPAGVRIFYFALLISHVLLATTVPVLALITIYHGLKDNRQKHRRIARWTFPIWLYVSVTGVIVYFMLYHLYPPREVLPTQVELTQSSSMLTKATTNPTLPSQSS